MSARRKGRSRDLTRRDPSGAPRPQDDRGRRPQDDIRRPPQDDKRRLLQDDSKPDPSTNLKSSQVLLFFGIVIVLLHVWGAVQPSHDNWGVHMFGFYGSVISILAFCLVLLLLIPKTQAWLLGVVEGGLRPLAKLPVIVTAVIVGGIILAGAIEFPAKLHLLGDGAVLLRSINQSQWGSDLVASFRNQPMMIWIFRSLMGFYATGGSAKPYDVYDAIDLLSCAMFVVLVFWFLRSLDRPLLERVLLGCFLFGCAGSQFFFGYVENYVLQYVITTFFAVTGWFAAEKRVSARIPAYAYAMMVGLHLGNLIFFPGLLVLVYGKRGDNRFRAMLVMAGLSVAIVGSMFAMGFNFNDFLRHITSGSVDFLQPFTAVGGNFAYPMFSVAHFWDWLNGSLLILPFGLAIAITLVSVHSKELQWKDPAFQFLLVTAACGLLFTWIINSALGMARDWDLLTSFFTPLMILDVYLLSRPIGLKSRRYLLAMIAGITLLHTGAWIGLNASADRHLRRMELLNNPRYMSLTTQLVFDEALANYFFDTQDYKDAKTYYELYLKIDDHNPRILANIADVYRRIGDRNKYFDALLRAVAANSRDPGVYLNLGVEYASRHDTAAAVKFNEQAVSMDSTQRLAHANLGILYTNLKNYPLAARHFSMAINSGLREPAVYRYAGDVYFVLEQYDRALHYYDSYLELVPADQKVRDARDRVRRALADASRQK